MELSDIPILLRQRGMTQSQLAVEVGVSPSYLWQLIHKHRPMSIDIFKKIEAVLGAPHGVQEKSESAFEAEPARLPLSPVRAMTLSEARALKANPPPPLQPAEKERLMAEIGELSAALRALPKLTDMTDEEILGFDEPGA